MATADRRVYLIVGLLSGAALAHEVLLLRLFSISHWSDVAHMVISLALLGGGASGTLLALAQDRLLENFPKVMPACATLFGLSAVICTAVALRLPLNAEEFAWDLRQWVLLASIYVLLGVPFLCAATGIGLALLRAGDRPGAVYAADLVGAGLGSVTVLLLIQAQDPGRSLALIGAVGLLSAALAWQVLGSGGRRGFVILLLFAAVLAAVPEEALAPRMTE